MRNLVSRRILIVEDNVLVGEHIADLVHRAGAIPLGPLCTTEEACDALDGRVVTFDAAIIDLHLDETSVGIADRLALMKRPFIFATGNAAEIPAHHRDRPVCEKPFTPQSLIDALLLAFGDEGMDDDTAGSAQVVYLDAAMSRRSAA